MRDGLYKADFHTPLNSGTGVVHILNGRLWGGDSALYYVGTFAFRGDEVMADIVTNRHTPNSQVTSVFGTDRVHASLQGKWSGDTAVLRGSAAEAPGIVFQARLSRIAD